MATILMISAKLAAVAYLKEKYFESKIMTP